MCVCVCVCVLGRALASSVGVTRLVVNAVHSAVARARVDVKALGRSQHTGRSQQRPTAIGTDPSRPNQDTYCHPVEHHEAERAESVVK